MKNLKAYKLFSLALCHQIPREKNFIDISIYISQFFKRLFGIMDHWELNTSVSQTIDL